MAARSWIFIRGMLRGKGHWGNFIEEFEKSFPNDEYELIDLPGNGDRCNELTPPSVAQIAEDLRSHSQFIKQGKRVHLFTLSLGSMAGVKWAEAHPDEIEHLYLMNTSSRWSPPWKRFSLSNYPHVLKLLFKKNPDLQERTIMGLITNHVERRNAVLPKMIQYTSEHPLLTQNFLRQMAAAATVQFPKLAPVPTTIFIGDGDRLVSPQCSEEIAKRWGIRAERHPWGGHDLAVDDPQWLLEHMHKICD